MKFIVVKVFQDYDSVEEVKFIAGFEDEMSALRFITNTKEKCQSSYIKKSEYIDNFLKNANPHQQEEIVRRFYPTDQVQKVLSRFEEYHSFWQLFQYDGGGNYPIFEDIEVTGFNNMKLPEEDGYNLFVVEIK